MQQELKVMSIEELEKYWDKFSEEYTKQISENMQVLSVSMINMIRIERSKKIIEIAVGGGNYVPHLLQRKNKDAELFLTDLSPDMLAITKARITQFLQDPISGPFQNFDFKTVVPKFDEPFYFENLKTHIVHANAEKLQYKDGEFDTYISSLCLQLTSDPVKMIQEAYRVLAPGGQAIFSVWGDKEESKMLSHMLNVFQKLGIKPPVRERSNFHLNDQQKLVEMFEKEGFGNILTWKQFIPMNMLLDKEDIEKHVSGQRTTTIINKMQVPEREQEIKDAIREEVLSILESKSPLGLQALVIKVQKPL